MFHQSISHDASSWLQSRLSPADTLAHAFYGSKRFAPERTLLSLASSGGVNTSKPDAFDVGETYLLWTVAVKSPLELILKWELKSLGLMKGATQLAFDPKIRRVYQGNAIDCVPAWAEPLLPAHERYATYLLSGMVDDIEKMAAEERI
jgi:hypothetical protein